MRNLILVLGDQLDRDSAAFDGFDAERDAVWMAENVEESTHVWCHKLRLAVFFSAMRHFRDELESRGVRVVYHELRVDGRRDSGEGFGDILKARCREERPEKLVVLEPGDYRVKVMLEAAAEELGLELEQREDRDFYATADEFREWAKGRKSLLLENWYRLLRKKHGILMYGDEPVGGEWNFDKDNREAFGKSGPDEVKAPRSVRPDDLTQDVIQLVNERFADHPGTTDHFDLPVTRREALALLRDFVEHRLPTFGKHQDAMWTGGHFHSHSRLSCAINLKLLRPREVVDKAVEAYESGHAPLNSVEGFVRQILGWREYVRGIYWLHMPGYLERNTLRASAPVPQFFWDGETDMACVANSMQNVLKHGYAHHIQRLMVLGLFSQLASVDPLAFHEWHMAMYLDAIDWVSAPNTIGMSQWADGGVVGSKPYCASGNYINRMSNYCKSCRYKPGEATGEDACPFTTLYWDFLARHRKQFESNTRMGMQLKNLDRKKDLAEIRKQADELKERLVEKARV